MSLNDQLSVLANRDRRQFLLALTDNPSVPKADVEANGGTQDQSIAMYHVHLPRLEDHGFITWKQETGEVAKGPHFDEIEPLLTVLSETFSTESADKPPN